MVLDFISDYLNINDRGAILVPLAILMSSIIGSAIALWAIISNRHMARLKNSMDFINSYNEDKDIDAALKEVAILSSKTSHEIEQIATHEGDLYSHAKNIMRILNHYEAMALCIHRNIYNEKIIKEAVYTTVTDIWKQCKPYVDERRKRKNNTTYFQEIEQLTGNWKKHPLKSKNKNKK